MKAKLLAFFFLFHTSHRSNFHIFHSIFFLYLDRCGALVGPLRIQSNAFIMKHMGPQKSLIIQVTPL